MRDEPDNIDREAERCVAEARSLMARDQTIQALEPLRRAVLLYATVDDAREPDTVSGDDPLRWMRADACSLFGDALTGAGQHAEAANIYQEATDLYGVLEGEQAAHCAHNCARKLLGNVAALRAKPQERLHLLIAHYERVQQQLALLPDTIERQGECCVHIARIYQRRDRPAEAVERYRNALEIYARAVPSEEVEMARAECHHRIGTLLEVRLDDPGGAIPHYRRAVTLYAEHEPQVAGVQQSLELCRAGLARSEAALQQKGNRRHSGWSRE